MSDSNIGCAICSEIFYNDYVEPTTSSSLTSSTACVSISCGHIYHRSCLERWFQAQQQNRITTGFGNGKTSCPKCRSPATLGTMKRLYFHCITGDIDKTSQDGNDDAEETMANNLKRITKQLLVKSKQYDELRVANVKLMTEVNEIREALQMLEINIGRVNEKIHSTLEINAAIEVGRDHLQHINGLERRLDLVMGDVRAIEFDLLKVENVLLRSELDLKNI